MLRFSLSRPLRNEVFNADKYPAPISAIEKMTENKIVQRMSQVSVKELVETDIVFV